MENTILAALAKTAFERNELEAGTYDVDTTIHVKGTLTVGEDYEKLATVSIPIIPTLAAVAALCGVTGPNAVNIITKAVGEAIRNGESGEDGIFAHKDEIADAVEKVKVSLARNLPKTTSKGQVRFKGTVEEPVTV